MNLTKRLIVVSGLVLAGSLSSDAHAQLFTPLDRKPKGYFVLGFDTSMSMARNYAGAYGSPNHVERAIRVFTGPPASPNYEGGAMYLFRDRFAFGTFAYSGRHYAHIKPAFTVAPNRLDLAASFQATSASIRGLTADYCVATKHSPDCQERYLPGGGSMVCITPTVGCTGDRAVLENLFHAIPSVLPGLVIPPLPATGTSTLCDNMSPVGYPDTVPTPDPLPAGCPSPTNPACPTLNPTYELWHELQALYYSYPRYDALNPPTPASVQSEICEPFEKAWLKLEQKVNACLLNPSGFLAFTPPFSCSAAAVANSICSHTDSPFLSSCVCDQSNALCLGGGPGLNECGRPYVFRARQQVAVCHSHDDDQVFYNTVRSPADDTAARDPTRCRPALAGFVTDGLDSAGVITEGAVNQLTYRAKSNVPQNYVFRMGQDVVAANEMQALLRSGLTPAPSLPAEDKNAVMSYFANGLNRSLMGTYSGGSPAVSRYQDRVAFLAVEVPGVADFELAPFAGHRTLDYLGRPARIEYYELDPIAGTIGSLLFSTDWSSRAGSGTPINGLRAYAGPAGTWRNGVTKVQPIAPNTLDRNGDGTTGDTHPPVTWGHHLGGFGSRPVIVDAPVDVPPGPDATAHAAWMSQAQHRGRPRVVYALSNGYLHAYKAGDHVGTAYNIGHQQISFQYSEGADAGRELFRYFPSFIENSANASAALVGSDPLYTFNDVAPVALIDRGQIIVRELQLSSSPPQFATVLIFSQGVAGRGYAALDVSTPQDPGSVVPLWDDVLIPDGGLAVSAPSVYEFPGGAGTPKPMLVITGRQHLYAYRVATGALATQTPLPATTSWSNTPLCVDTRGAGLVTHCYVLGDDGTIIRVEISPVGLFTGTEDITPVGPESPRGGGRVFKAGLSAFFTAENDLALVFGSGDISRLERGDGTQNYFYKVIDEYPRTGVAGLARLSTACAPSGTPVLGRIALGPSEMVVSPPAVGKGMFAFTTFKAPATGCEPGDALLYAADFMTCRDLLADNTLLPVAKAVGAGLPSSPTLLRRAERLVVHTSAAASGAQASVETVSTRGGQDEVLRPLFWRLRTTAR